MDIVLQATRRTTGSRSVITRLRKEGKLPGVIYGFNVESTPVFLDYKETAKAVQKYGRTSIFKIDLEGKQLNVILNETQRCALKGTVKHVDFKSISMSEEIEVEVPITPIGESMGVKEGGVLTQPIRELKMKVKPSAIPETIEVDVSNLQIGESINVGEIRNTLSYNILNEDEDTIITVTPPVVVNDETAGQGEENADIKATEAPESEN